MRNNMIYAIGDIHGCHTQLVEILKKIEQHYYNFYRGSKPQIIFLGDYVDRGPNSRQVIELLMSLDPTYHRFLRGNHEEAMIQACYNGALKENWLSNFGGKNTAASYGIHGPEKYDLSKIPENHIEWLIKLPTMIEEEKQVFVHGGLEPGKPISDQSEEYMIWSRWPFLESDYDWSKHVVHGHTITPRYDDTPFRKNRTNLDYGCYDGGKLMCGVFTNRMGPPLETISVPGSNFNWRDPQW